MKQNYELKNERIRADFLAAKSAHPERFTTPLRFSWSNWGFGLETLETSAERLRDAGIPCIELHGNHHGPDLGYRAADVNIINITLDAPMSEIKSLSAELGVLSGVQVKVSYIHPEWQK